MPANPLRPTVGENCFGHLMQMWEGMALANPDYLHRKYSLFQDSNDFINYTRSQLEYLVYLQRIDDVTKDSLMSTLGAYLHATNAINWSSLSFADKQNELVDFWKMHKLDLQDWFSFAIMCYLHQPSSAAAERVFSMLKALLETGDVQALDDIIIASVYLRYKNRLF